MSDPLYQILLYYKYVDIPNPEAVRDEQRALCQSLGLKGRIIIAQEGINGTVEGFFPATEKYIATMQQRPYFKNISYKKSVGTGSAFSKLSVKVRPEIVTARMPQLNPNNVTGHYLSADELQRWFKEKKEFYIVDMRNDYEYLSGYFEGFIPSGIHNFYDLPSILPKLTSFKKKTLVTVCTGGVRCEKASGFLIENGFSDVYQLKDGIQAYLQKYPNQYFKGKLYVFDNRLTLGFNRDDSAYEIVGKCFHCRKPCDTYVNCEYDICHYHYICCRDCLDTETGLAFDKRECKEQYLHIQQ